MGTNTVLTLSQIAGGIGIFMLGMIVMTEGLRALAGESLRKALMRFTKTPASGALTGAVTTAILQSSSATTVAAVGFVGAGLLAFPEALGIVFGANIGTTFKGWIWALLGFNFKLGTVLFPLILLGAMFKLFFSGRLAAFGYALAGFSLIFVGIEWMQTAMSGIESVIIQKYLPQDSWIGRVQLLLVGIIATVITQSSSAGVAATLVLLYSGLIGFGQAAALVVGMDIGTTFTAAVATIGGSVEVKRTGLSHVFYNFFTGFGALLFITPYSMGLSYLIPNALESHAELALVGFHTLFNTIGVLIVIPFAPAFARMMERIIPTPAVVKHYVFDPKLLEDIPLALSVIQKKLEDEWDTLLEALKKELNKEEEKETLNLERMEQRLDEIEAFIDTIDFGKKEEKNWKRLVEIIHVLDHMQRLIERMQESQKENLLHVPTLQHEYEVLSAGVASLQEDLKAGDYQSAAKDMKGCARQIRATVLRKRKEVASLMADDTLSMKEGVAILDGLNWLKRSSSHLNRIARHLEAAVLSAGER